MPRKKAQLRPVGNINAAAAMSDPRIASIFADRERAQLRAVVAEERSGARGRRVCCVMCGPSAKVTLYRAGIDRDGRAHYGCFRHREQVSDFCRQHREQSVPEESHEGAE
jgi:hypothetical protein